MSNPPVSVVIPAYNCEKTISQTLTAIFHQSYCAGIEIIVVDDGSKDSTIHQVKNYSKVLYLRQENAGPATARNHGARKANHEFICFTDSDCIPEPDWIEKLMRNFQDAECRRRRYLCGRGFGQMYPGGD